MKGNGKQGQAGKYGQGPWMDRRTNNKEISVEWATDRLKMVDTLELRARE